MNRVLMKLDLCSVTMASSSLLVGLGLLRGDHGADGERAQSVGDRQGAFGRVLSPGEGKHVRPALALGIDVHPADLVDERINKAANLIGLELKMLTC